MYNKKEKPVLFTGITASGTLTLGHYFGVIQNLVKLQNKYQIIVMIADLHAITTISEKKVDYNKKTREIASLIYASGLKEENCKVFVQSKIKGHLELFYYLLSYCYIGKLKNMIQYKEKSKSSKSSSFSLLSYPILMASDILLYDADLVIVGKDQKQHLELTTYIANKFNTNNDNCLKIPEYFIPEIGSKIMGLRNPLKKMSKSGDDYISLLDSENKVKNKILKAKTDSDGRIYFDWENKPGISNLLVIHSCIKNISIEESESFFLNCTYEEFKEIISDEINELLKNIQSRFDHFNKKIDILLDENNEILSLISDKKINEIRKKINLYN